ncbi:MAG: FAD:protein FMN transferase [Candidatus Hatepunaea meridiana]|nr:FAD:protein FMN transferase [Candidatus Hatepunaea meridiana]
MTARIIIVIISVLSFLCGCSTDKPQSYKYNEANYTLEIQAVAGDIGRKKCSSLMKDAAKVFSDRLDLIRGENSVVDKLNSQRDSVEIPPEFYSLLSRIDTLSKSTGDTWSACLGEVRKLWGFNSSKPSRPDPDIISQQARAASLTEIVLLEGNRVSLLGEGSLYLRSVSIGWALDAAAQVMIDGDVEAAMLEAGGVYRSWGSPSAKDKWIITVKAPSSDSTEYKISPDAGGMCLINLSDIEVDIGDGKINDIIDPLDGEPAEGMINLIVWTPDAMQTCIFAEATFVMGRGCMLNWIEGIDSVGVFFIWSDDIDTYAESNTFMEKWISIFVP